MKRIEHLGIAVNDLSTAIQLYEALLNTKCYKQEEVVSEGDKTAFFQVGESKIELLEASNPASPIAKFLQKNGPGFHHVAFEVDDIEAELERLFTKSLKMVPTTKELPFCIRNQAGGCSWSCVRRKAHKKKRHLRSKMFVNQPLWPLQYVVGCHQ